MTDAASTLEPASSRKPSLPPPSSTVGVTGWIRQNLLSSPLNIALTIAAVWLIYETIPPFLDWALFSANFQAGTSREDCVYEGACWTMVRARFGQFMYGYYPDTERWRVDLAFLLFVAAAVPLLI